MDYVKYIMAELHACGHLRGELIAREMNKRYNDIRMDIKMDMFQSDTIGTSLMVFLRMHQQAFLDRMIAVKRLGIKTAYDVDDDLFNIPPECSERYDMFKDPTFVGRHQEFVQAADAVIVSTKTLAGVVKQHTHSPVFIVPNSLDIQNWEATFAKRMTSEPSDTVTIGWTNSSFHTFGVPIIEEALVQIMEEFPNVRFHSIGFVNLEHFKTGRMEAFKDRCVCEDWVPIDRFPEAMVDMDIGIAPLNDCKYNMSRSGIKWMQYSALGIPTIASPFPPYEDVMTDNETGMFAKMNTPKGWHDCLKKLIVDRDLRIKMGFKARREVLDKHDIRNNVAIWRDCYKQIMELK